MKLAEDVLGDILGVEVMVFFTIFSFTSFCLISFVRLFSSSFMSLEEMLPFLEVGGVASLFPLPAAADLRVLTVAEEEVCWMTVVVVVVEEAVLADWTTFWLAWRFDVLMGVDDAVVSRSSLMALKREAG